MHAATKRRNIQKLTVPNQLDLYPNSVTHEDLVASDNDGSYYESEDEFEDPCQPTSGSRTPPMRQKKRLGPPITIDDKIQRLDRIHRYAVEDFMVHATNECRKVGSPFTPLRV